MTASLQVQGGRLRLRSAVLTVFVGLAVVLASAPIVSAAPATNAWTAKIGTAGANGTATINAFTTGTGSIVLKLAKLRASVAHTVVISKGTCSSVGAALLKLASIKTTSAGAAARTTTLTTAQVTAIKAATKGTGKIAIRVAYGGTAKCGVFAVSGVPPYVAAQVNVGRSPSGVVIDASGVWVTNWWDNTLSRIDPATNTVLSVVPVDFTDTQGPEAIGSGGGSLWVTATAWDVNDNPLPSVVKRIDPATGATLATIPVGAGAYDIDVSAGAIWVACVDGGSVIRIDPATNQVVATIPIPKAYSVTVGLGAVWVSALDGKVTRIDPATNQIVTSIPTQATGGYVATGNGAVWVTHPGDEGLSTGSLSRIDPETNQVVANTSLGTSPQELAVVGQDVWVGMYGEASVVRVSATTNAVLNRVAVSSKVYSIAAGPDVVWAVHNLPTPTGGSEPPVGAVSRISATAPVVAVAPTPSPTPVVPPPAGGTLFMHTYFTLNQPAGWSLMPSGDPNTFSFSGPGAQVMRFAVEPTPLSLEGTTAAIVAANKNVVQVDPERTETITVGGSPARLLTYHYTQAGVPLHVLEAIVVRGGRVYAIVHLNLVGSEAADRALALSVLASLTFTSAAG